jgi:hypothetical protein
MKSAIRDSSGKSDNCSIWSSRAGDVKLSCVAPRASGRIRESALRSVSRSARSKERPRGAVRHASALSIRQIRRNDVLPHATLTPMLKASKTRTVRQGPQRPNRRKRTLVPPYPSVSCPSCFRGSYVGFRDARVLLTCEPGSLPSKWRWAPLTVIMPRYSPGCDDAWALGPTELFSRPAQGLGQFLRSAGESEVRQSVESGVAVGRATGTQDNKPRFGLTSCGRKVGSPKPPHGSRVFVAACRTETLSVPVR